MNVVYFGSGAFGLPTLAHLASAHRLTGVVTQPDRPAGRGGRPTPTPIAAWAGTHLPGVPVLKPEKVNDPGVVAMIRAWPADAWVVVAFGQKLGRALLADRFAINLHASLLPRWRGAAPINAAILAGDAVTGNSVITLADRMDAGQVLGQSHREIEPTATAGELHDALAGDGPPLVEAVLARRAAGAIDARPQDESLVTIAPKLTRADGSLSFATPADDCRRRINALSPWPCVTATFRGGPLKLLRAAPSPAFADAAPGTIVGVDDGLVACAPGTALRLLEVQAPGKRPMPWADYARGARVSPGEQLHAFHPEGHS